MKTKKYIIFWSFLGFAVITGLACANKAYGAYQPPIGIPAPSFGIDEPTSYSSLNYLSFAASGIHNGKNSSATQRLIYPV